MGYWTKFGPRLRDGGGPSNIGPMVRCCSTDAHQQVLEHGGLELPSVSVCYRQPRSRHLAAPPGSRAEDQVLGSSHAASRGEDAEDESPGLCAPFVTYPSRPDFPPTPSKCIAATEHTKSKTTGRFRVKAEHTGLVICIGKNRALTPRTPLSFDTVP